MLGRKKAAPEPLSLSSPVSNTSKHQPNSSRSIPLSGVASPSSATPASPRPFDPSRSPASAGLSPSIRSRPGPKRPQTAKGSTSQLDDIVDASSPEQFGQRRPSQASYNTARLPSATPSTSTSPTDQQHPPESPSARRVPSNDKKTKGSFLHFAKPSRTTNHLPSHGQRAASGSWNQFDSRGTDGPDIARHGADQWQTDFPRPTIDHRLETSTSDISISSGPDRQAITSPTSPRRTKPKGFGLLTRTKSNRERESGKHRDAPDPMPSLHTDYDVHGDTPLRTAPVSQERSFREMMDSQVRNRSASRSRDNRGRATPPPVRENGGSTFLSGLRNTKAAGMFGKGFFGKGSSRGTGTNDRVGALDDEHYELKVLKLPLMEQTRITRISKRLENSRDKTEFWMPAFPWRAIDYLNYKGCEVEGLYRVPGSGPQVKRWQRRFDEEHDVNLFEVDDLYDINVVGSMLKAWLRELPDELFPKSSQERVARESTGTDKVPQVLIDELSNLSPFQYYLLFAITCHLSLLLAHSDKNKMDFRNLCICFQPCMRIDSYCFKFLVCDWRDCWKGCKNEAYYIEQEYILFDQPPPRGFVQPSHTRSLTSETGETPDTTKRVDKIPRKKLQERSDSDSSSRLRQEISQDKPQEREAATSSLNSRGKDEVRDEKRNMPPPKPKKEHEEKRQPSPAASNGSDSSYHSANDKLTEPTNSRFHTSDSKNSVSSGDRTISTTLTINSDREPPTRTLELRPLSPIKPLSPMFARTKRTGKEPGSPPGVSLGGQDEDNT